MSRPNSDPETKMVAEIVVAYLSRNEVDRKDVPQFIAEVRAALFPDDATAAVVPTKSSLPEQVEWVAAPQRTEVAAVSEVLTPAAPPEDSVSDTYIICLEDGRRFRSLRRHLMAKYGLTPDDYRRKWNLPPDYPMVAPSYARDRSAVAKRIGLGQNKPPASPVRRRLTTKAT